MDVEEKAGEIVKGMEFLTKPGQIIEACERIAQGLREYGEVNAFKVLDKVREGIREGQRMAFESMETLVNKTGKGWGVIHPPKGYTPNDWSFSGCDKDTTHVFDGKGSTLQEALEKAEAENET